MAASAELVFHLRESLAALSSLEAQMNHVDQIGNKIARRLVDGARLLAAGNGGSAAEAQHLTAELVGRYRRERRALSAIALHADTSAFTAITNDYGQSEGFARQVEAHGREGDVLVLFSTSGRSSNLLEAARRAEKCGVWTVAITGKAGNPLAELAEDAITVNAISGPAIQEAHLVVVHLLCAVIDALVVPSAFALPAVVSTP